MTQQIMPENQIARGDGWHINYMVKGSGPTLILLHGGGPGASGWSNYNRNLDAFAEHYTTYLIDFPGWAGSSKNLDSFGAKSPFRNGAVALNAFMEAVGIEKAHLVGNSFGGSVAFYMCLDFPDRVDRIVTMGPGGAYLEGSTGPTEGIRQLMTYYMGEGPTREKLAAFLQNLVYDPSRLPEDMLEQRFLASNDPEIVANAPLRPPEGRTGPPPKEMHISEDPRLKDMPHRALMIWGLQDRVNLPAGAFAFKAVPDQDLFFFDKCGHWAQWEQADKFNDLVLWFLGRA
jgi:4,5:9,10-diseco-3-hydroxy-5,9,17-trioxoandrosta-1(10),2-diene-4-oate hydrolase